MRPLCAAISWICLCLLAGCNGGGAAAPKLAPADGTVTYKGSPLAGATVTFVPDSGPLAMGVTDLQGKFTLSTGALPGVVVGNAKATVSMVAPGSGGSSSDFSKVPTTDAAREEYYKKAAEKMTAQQSGTDASSQPKSLVPEKYASASSSGLSYTVNKNGDNHYKIELVD